MRNVRRVRLSSLWINFIAHSGFRGHIILEIKLIYWNVIGGSLQKDLLEDILFSAIVISAFRVQDI